MVEAVVGSVAGSIGGSLANKVLGGDKAQAGGSGVQQIHNTSEVLIPDYLKGIIHGGDDSLVSRANEFSLRPYAAYTDPRYAGFNQDQQNAMQGVRDSQGMYGSQFDSALGMNQQVADRVNAGFVTPDSIARYMNPYQQNVTDIAKRESLRDFDKQMNTLGDRAMMTGAFGGDRNAIAEMESYRDINQRLDDLQVQGSHAAYNNALDTSLNVGMSEAQALGNAATNQGNLATAAQNSRFNDLANLQQIGGQQQALDQSNLDFNYGQYMEEREYPAQQMAQLASTVYPLLGQSGTQTGNTQSFNPGLSNANAALGGAALGNAIFGGSGGGGGFNVGGNTGGFGNFMNSTFGTSMGTGGGGSITGGGNPIPGRKPTFREGGIVKYARGGPVKDEHKYFLGGLTSALGGGAGGGMMSSILGGAAESALGSMFGGGGGSQGAGGGGMAAMPQQAAMASPLEKYLMMASAAKEIKQDPLVQALLAGTNNKEVKDENKYFGGGLASMLSGGGGGFGSGGMGGLTSMISGLGGGGGLSGALDGVLGGNLGSMGLLGLLNKTGLMDGMGLDGLFGGSSEGDEKMSPSDKLKTFSPAAKMWDDPKSMSPLASLLFAEGGKIPEVQKYQQGGRIFQEGTPFQLLEDGLKARQDSMYKPNADSSRVEKGLGLTGNLLSNVVDIPARAVHGMGVGAEAGLGWLLDSPAQKKAMEEAEKAGDLETVAKLKKIRSENASLQDENDVGSITLAMEDPEQWGHLITDEMIAKNPSLAEIGKMTQNARAKATGTGEYALMNQIDALRKEAGLKPLTPSKEDATKAASSGTQAVATKDPSMEKWDRNPDRSIFAKAPLPGLAMAAKIFDSAGVNPLSAFGQGLGAYVNETKEGNAAEAKAKTDEMDNLIDMMNARSVQTQAAIAARKAQLEESSLGTVNRKKELETMKLEREMGENPLLKEAVDSADSFIDSNPHIAMDPAFNYGDFVKQRLRDLEAANIQGTSEETSIDSNNPLGLSRL